MKKTIVNFGTVSLMGLAVRTSNEAEMAPDRAQIGKTMAEFLQGGWKEKMPKGEKQGRLFSVYTKFESDFTGPYTYFVGQEVPPGASDIPGLTPLILPAQSCVRFTTSSGPLPQVVIKSWQQIWEMSEADLGGRRAYIADFEIYDERSQDQDQAVVDIYLGIRAGL